MQAKIDCVAVDGWGKEWRPLLKSMVVGAETKDLIQMLTKLTSHKVSA